MTNAANVFTPPTQVHQNTAPAAVRQVSGTAPTAPTNQHDQNPQDRFLDMRDGANRSRIGDRELSEAEYNSLTYTERLEYAERRTALANGNQTDPAAPATDPAAAPGQKFTVGKFEVTEAQIEAMMQRQSAEDLKKATLPAAPDKYELKIAEGATLPGNVAVSFDSNDPGLAAARNWAHAKGLSQGDFSEMLTIYASHVAQQEMQIAEARAREIEKVGPNGTQRINAIETFIRSQVGDEDTKKIMGLLATDAQLRFYEKMATRFANPHGSSFHGGRREPPETGISEEQWNKMTYSERKEYSERASAMAVGGGYR